MQVTIKPSKAKGRIQAPPSKSMAHRLLICAGLSKGTSRVSNVAFSQDILATMDCLESLGASYTVDGDVVTVTGAAFNSDKSILLNCRECGSTLRFMIPICMTFDDEINLTGSTKLMSRPLDVYKDIASKQSLCFNLENDILTVKGRLSPGEYEIDGGISSQFISGLMFSLPLLNGDSVLKIIPPVESRPYIDMTIEALRLFGIKITQKDACSYVIKGKQTYKSADVSVEGDYSNSAFLESLNLIGGEVDVTGLNPKSHQGDKIYREYFEMIKNGEFFMDIANCPDLGPILFAVASIFKGAFFLGTKRLKWKESDRVISMMHELLKCGIHMTAEENRVQIHNCILKAPKEVISGHNDHRIVMAMSIILTLVGGTIDGAEAVAKSYPDFFEKLKSLGIEVEINGMDK